MKKKYDKEKQFNVKVNTYICRALYKYMGNQRADVFLDNQKENGSKKKIYIRWYALFGDEFSEIKIQRIISGERASCFTEAQAEIIGRLFNIDKKYFLKDNELIQVGKLNEEIWKKFLNKHYELDYAYAHVSGVQGDIIDEQVKNELIHVIEKYNTTDGLKSTDPLYRICWYYENGKTFEDDQIPAIVRNRVQAVFTTTPYEWSKCSQREISEFIKSLTETAELLRAYQICSEKFKI